MALRRRGFIALAIVFAMLSLVGPAALARALPSYEPAAESAFSAEAAFALRIDSGTGESPGHEQSVLRLAGGITTLEEDDSDLLGDGQLLMALSLVSFEPARRLPVAELTDVLRLVIARGWRALPCARGPPAA
jgi:hypothetical protein